MNPKNYKKPADLMRAWNLTNLIEYKSIILDNIDDIKDELSRGCQTGDLQKKLEHNETMLVVVDYELKTRY